MCPLAGAWFCASNFRELASIVPITFDIDIYRTANELIKQHVEDAPIHAAMRADELLEAGDLDGQATLKQILKTIDELQSRERPEGEKIH